MTDSTNGIRRNARAGGYLRAADGENTEPAVYLAFGFHINTSHSYRIDSNDARGFAKDLVMIERILDALDAAEERGVGVCGVWDTEQMFAIEECMFRDDVKGGRELLSRIQHRVRSGRDEVIHMSYNNGLAGGMTRDELDAVISRSRHNDRGSGIVDLFGCDSRIVRPQEMMLSSGSAEVYRSHGIDTVCLYYSATPFGTFRPFIRPLSAFEAHNPLRLERNGDPAMRVIPTYHTTDLIEHVSLRHWVRELHKRQRSSEIRGDVLLFVNFDADHESWGGFDLPAPLRVLPNSTGLSGLISSVEQLDFVRFTSLQSYLDEHDDCGTISFEQDTADGAWNGYASWSEKYSSHVIFRAVRNDRRVERYTDQLKKAIPANERAECEAIQREAFDHRLRLLSTTCYGLATPFVAPGREAACKAIIGKLDACHDRLRDIVTRSAGSAPAQEKGSPGALRIERDGSRSSVQPAGLSLIERDGGFALTFQGESLLAAKSFIPTITYAGRTVAGEDVVRTREQSQNRAEIAGLLRLPEARVEGWFSYQFTEMIVGKVPLLLVDGSITFPETPPDTRVHPGVEGLDRVWDSRWEEVEPFPLRLARPEYERSRSDEPGAVVSRENAFGRVGSFPIDYHLRNARNWYIPSMNNHITEPWCALSVNGTGIAIGFDERSVASFAPVPIRAVDPFRRRLSGEAANTGRFEAGRDGRVRTFDLNPLGSYYGPQWASGSWGRGVGIRVMEEAAEHLASSAPTFNGRTLYLCVVLVPFCGPLPPEDVQNALRAACRPAGFMSTEARRAAGFPGAASPHDPTELGSGGPIEGARVKTQKERSMPVSALSIAEIVRDSLLKPPLRFPDAGHFH